MGGLAGGMRRRDQRLQQNQQRQMNAQAASNSQQSQRNAYNRAMASFLTGSGYTVKLKSQVIAGCAKRPD
jgi:hypothetical protein